LLEQLGLVTKTEMGVGRIMYHPVDKGHHHHLVCRSCGNVVDLDESALTPLKESLLRDYQFIADLRHLGILGYVLTAGRNYRTSLKMGKDTKENLKALLKYWIAHNQDHSKEFREWAEKAKAMGDDDVANEIQQAVEQ